MECLICEDDDISEEDMLQMKGKAICKWCASDIAKERFGSRLTKRAADEVCSCGSSINANVVLGDGVVRCTVCRKPRR